jgi:hypothetical protein
VLVTSEFLPFSTILDVVVDGPGGLVSTPVGDNVNTDAEDEAAEAALAEAEANTDDGDNADEGGWDEDAAKRKFENLKKDLDKARAQVKELSPKAAEAEKARQATLTETQRLAETLAERENEVKSLTLANLRRDAALAANLPADFVEFLTGETDEELAAQAKRLAKHLTPPAEKRPADLRQGARGAAPSATVNKNDLIRRMAGFDPAS